MARYLVEEDTPKAARKLAQGPVEGLAVAKAMAQKMAAQLSHSVVVRNEETGEELARFVGQNPEESQPSLARSVRRMRAANDRLKEGLVPFDPAVLAQTGRDKK